MTDRHSLTDDERRDLSRLAGLMVPASTEHGVPGADDAIIQADLVGSLGRDRAAVSEALAMLRTAAGGDFSRLDEPRASAVAMELLARRTPAVTALGRVVLQCYYRDERVLRSLGIEPRAPFPKGNALPDGDWSLLEPVRGRPRMWRDVGGEGGRR